MLQPRQQYGLGSLVKSAVKGVTGAVKGVASGIKSLASSDVGKLALLAAAGSYGLGMGPLGGIRGAGFLKGLPGASAIGEYLGTKGGRTLLMAGAGTLLGGVLAKAEQGDPEAMQVTRDVGALKNYLTSGYTNLGYSAEEIPALVEKDLSEYTKLGGYATGGRVGFSDGLGKFPIIKDGFFISPDYENMTEEQKIYQEGMKLQEKKRQDKIKQILNRIKESQPENERFSKPVPMPTYSDKIKKANGGRIGYSKGTNRDEEQPIKELKDADPNLRAGPDWYMKRIEALMYEYDMDYDEAAEIAFDSNKYFDLMPDEFATGGRVGYAGGGRDETPEEKMFREMKNAKVQAAIKLAGEKNIGIGKAMAITNEDDFNLKTGKYEGSDEGIKKLLNMKAMGGRVQYSNGTPSESDRVKELMDDGYTFGEAVKKVMEEQKQRENKAYGSKPEDNAKRASGIMNIPLNKNKAGVTELDMRENGGFIPPVGVKEKADDIPAMLSNNEFVFTADAVRGMGNGNVNVGAQRMYDMMKYLEKGGRV